MITVVLADDEAMVRAGVRAILASDPTIDVVAEAGDGRQAIELVHKHRPDVVLLDIRMPMLDGLAAARELHKTMPGTGVIMLTTFGEDEYIARALQEGASGFLLKSGDPAELVAGVRAVAHGAAYLSPKVAHRVISELSSPRASRATQAKDKVAQLTERERAVLALLGAGMSNADIARRLLVVEGTVKGHVSAIFERLAVRNRVQAAILAYEAELVDEE
ncbi:MAG: response regulator transcription factor [Corynebacteriales bacterium]|nr:response regulator transcription factor [Mycobacteriales bacterium]